VSRGEGGGNRVVGVESAQYGYLEAGARAGGGPVHQDSVEIGGPHERGVECATANGGHSGGRASYHRLCVRIFTACPLENTGPVFEPEPDNRSPRLAGEPHHEHFGTSERLGHVEVSAPFFA